MLDDKTIRKELKIYLNSNAPFPQVIVDEMNVHNGNARADLVAFYDEIHCFEIKSDRDSLCRLKNQIEYYDYTFNKVSIVVTDKFINKIDKHIPSYWGVLLAKIEDGQLNFYKERCPKANPNWEAEKALLSLWKNELLELDTLISKKHSSPRTSRAELAKKIGSESNGNIVSHELFSLLRKRFLGDKNQSGSFQIEEKCSM
ncbi:sce7726 family protein [Shewanella metallivivens]|uniref:Sce7726 family protein n=1 Tax=Shewanella metallivivens TaxID=2872342 RepID=A0ABT5TLL8_9GAMM|nr:sce7726 family protein [Shewanella metallivivens]